MRLALAFVLLIASVTTAAQTPSPRPTRVFVSGHSLTDLPMPAYLERIAGSLGTPLDWNRQYMVGSAIKHRTRGRGNEEGWAGYSMGDNRAGQGLDVVKELRHRAYDVLLITEQSGVIDSLLTHDMVRHLRHYHDRFIDGNERGQTFFYEPWLSIPGRTQLDRWINYERAASPVWQCIVSRVNQSLQADRRSDRIVSLPVGAALAELMASASRGQIPGLQGATKDEVIGYVFNDNVHLKPLGAYFVSLVAFMGIFGKSPVGAWAPSELPVQQAHSLQIFAASITSRLTAERKALSAAACSSLVRGSFINLYIAQVKDGYWSGVQGNRLRMAWRRLKWELRIRWTLWRRDPLA